MYRVQDFVLSASYEGAKKFKINGSNVEISGAGVNDDSDPKTWVVEVRFTVPASI
jgi:hypothetical protein